MSWSAQNSSRLDIKASPEQYTSRSNLPSVHTTRSPLSPLDLRRNSVTSQASSTAEPSPPSISSDINSPPVKDFGHQTVNHGVETRFNNNPNMNQNQAPNEFASPTSQTGDCSQPASSDVPESAMYIYNSLQSFSFGNAQIQTNISSSRPVDPLSPSQHEGDSYSDDFSASASNDTPRPSVVAQHYRDNPLPIISSHPAQESPTQPYSPASLTPMSPGASRRVVKDRDRENDSPSFSASVTSFSSQSGPLSRADSPTSCHTSTTNQTSPHDYSSADDDDASNNSSRVTDDALISALTDRSTSELTYEDEYGGSEFEDEVYSDEEAIIEIGSAHFEGIGSSTSHEWERALYSSPNGGGGSLQAISLARRNSLPMGLSGEDLVYSGRMREDSLATLRRPSRSLDDEFQKLGFNRLDNPNNILNLDESASRPGAPSPTSVPQTDADWRRLENRSSSSTKGKEVDRHPLVSAQSDRWPLVYNGSLGQEQQHFDMSEWTQMQGGITSFDQNQLGDIVAPTGPQAERKTSTGGLRFFSFWSSGNRRPSAATVSTIHGDSFGRAVGRWGGSEYLVEKRDWTMRKEKADSGGAVTVPVSPSPLSPRSSFAGDRTESLASTETTVVKPDRYIATYKGMPLGSVELWRNDRVGRFKVDRKVTKPSDSSKGPQQRLIVTPIADPYIQNYDGQRGPPITVHKHSKAAAFSISRHYRWEKQESRGSEANQLSPHGPNSKKLVPTHKKGSSMILLAPRRVQEAFTNTNTTRRLESHGLLEDKGQERKRQKARDTRRDRRRDEPSSRSRAAERSRDDSTIGTNTMNSSISGATLIPPPPASAPTQHTYPPIYPLSSSEASVSRESGLDRASSHHAAGPSRRRRKVRDPLDFDPDEEEEELALSRTPYPEVYGTVDATYLEHQNRTNNESNEGFWAKFSLRRPQPTLVPGTTPNQRIYDPPWMTMASRNKQEQQQRVVDNLNTSFKDVGLLPSPQRDKSTVSRKPKKISGKSSEKVDIFKDIPPDALYLLLPLWPGETDHSSSVTFPFEKPIIPSKDRQYLLIYYKTFGDVADEDHRKSRGETESKKRSRGSQNSHDSTHSQKDKAHILLSSFHITARVVSYADLQGSGVRVPDDGLAVTGPLQEAFAKKAWIDGNDGLLEWVLGACHSREAGIEFYPETFRRMNLCTPTEEEPILTLISEEDQIPNPNQELTPLGRAVMEMAWVGGMALTSFG